MGGLKPTLTGSKPKLSVANFAILALVGSIQANTLPLPMGIYENQVRMGPHWTAIESHTER